MRLIPTLIIVLVLILVNDLLLVKYLEGRFSSSTVVNRNPATTVQFDYEVPAASLSDNQNPNQQTESKVENAEGEKTRPSTKVKEQEFIATLRGVANSDEFADILSQVQAESQQRRSRLSEQFEKLDASQLYDIFVNSERQLERNLAIGLLQNKGLRDLQTEQLRALYQYGQTNNYIKTEVLTVLIERDDPESITWAKEFIQTTPRQYSGDILNYIYEKDPGYVTKLIDEMDVRNPSQFMNMAHLLHSEPDLRKHFYSKHLDTLLDAKNPRLFEMGVPYSGVAITAEQQRKVAALFASRNRSTRQFAMGFVNAIEDQELLREVFYSLGKSQEKVQFVSILMSHKDDEIKNLANQILAASDDPKIKKLAEYNLQRLQHISN